MCDKFNEEVLTPDMDMQETLDFYIHDKKNTVAAVFRTPQDIVLIEMLNVLNKASGNAFLVNEITFNDSMLINGTYRAKANCHETDEFDETHGMDLSKLRALRAYYKDRTVVSDRIKAIFDDAAVRMEKAAAHNRYMIEHLDEKIKQLEE